MATIRGARRPRAANCPPSPGDLCLGSGLLSVGRNRGRGSAPFRLCEGARGARSIRGAFLPQDLALLRGPNGGSRGAPSSMVPRVSAEALVLSNVAKRRRRPSGRGDEHERTRRPSAARPPATGRPPTGSAGLGVLSWVDHRGGSTGDGCCARHSQGPLPTREAPSSRATRSGGNQ
jgi:hypothetical protein